MIRNTTLLQQWLTLNLKQKRPSRFDRKYYFPDPDLKQRVAYCKFWQSKLVDNKEIEFPDKLCWAIAEITDDFSFAYMQEAFVAALLAIARRSESGAAAEKPRPRDRPANNTNLVQMEMEDGWMGVHTLVHALSDDTSLDKLPLWVEIKKQIEILREGMDDEEGQARLGSKKRSPASLRAECTFKI